MSTELSAADVMALTKDADGMNGIWNNPFIYFVWMALFANGGLFGNRNGMNDAAVQGALTRSELYDGLNSQDIRDNQREILSTIGNTRYDNAQNAFGIQSALNNGFYGVNAGMAENRFAAQQCCCTTQKEIAALAAENFKNTCEITTAIHAEGEATRALITENTMQNLRDKLADKDRELLASNLFSAQQAQTQNLIGTLRPFPQPAYITTSPYASVSNCTCGYNS